MRRATPDKISHRLEEEELMRKPFTVKCTFMYDIYGIVKEEKYSCNKGKYFVSISHIILPNKGNLNMSIVYCGALDKINNICGTIALDNSSSIAQIIQHCHA